jgi:hypothetical protein
VLAASRSEAAHVWERCECPRLQCREEGAGEGADEGAAGAEA